MNLAIAIMNDITQTAIGCSLQGYRTTGYGSELRTAHALQPMFYWQHQHATNNMTYRHGREERVDSSRTVHLRQVRCNVCTTLAPCRLRCWPESQSYPGGLCPKTGHYRPAPQNTGAQELKGSEKKKTVVTSSTQMFCSNLTVDIDKKYFKVFESGIVALATTESFFTLADPNCNDKTYCKKRTDRQEEPTS